MTSRHPLSRSAVIAGVGHTAFGSLEGRSTISLTIEAARVAISDAGVDKTDIDAIFVKPPTSAPELLLAQRLAEAMGLRPRLGNAWDQGGAANAAMIAHAVMAINAGLCDVALVCFADNPKTGSRHAYSRSRGDDAVYGWFGVPPAYAMVARRHMQQFGTTAEQLGQVAINARRNGAANPHAQLRKPITLDDYMASPFIASPLRRDDCALVSDGAAAVIVMSAKRAKAQGIDSAVAIAGFGAGQQSAAPTHWPDLTTTMAVGSASTAFAMAGMTPADIDIAQLYDCFSIVPIVTLEDYGFCRKGEGGAFVEGGRIALDGELPLNTAGGLLSETGMPGMQLIIEGVRQLRGTAVSQVKDAATCIVSNQGGVMQSHSTLILAR